MSTTPSAGTRVVDVPLGDRAYRIHIGDGHLNALASFLPRMHSKIAIVTNDTIAPLFLDRVVGSLSALGISIVQILIPDGEAHKTVATWLSIHDRLLSERLDRKSAIVALGGGVVGDVAGFAAATYQRGIAFIQVPTTLLSQVDSSVGGKTGINHPSGKNMIGAFHQPQTVLIDTSTLATLPLRELRAGLAEVIKYGLIRDRDFFAWLERNIDALLARDPDALGYAIEVSCRHKAEVVVADETEQGERALLNLGHTFGHAIEAGLGFGQWLHGEAIAAGTVQAARLSAKLGWLSQSDVDRVTRLMSRAGLPVEAPALGADRYLDLMGRDKKTIGGRLRLVLLKSIGEGVVTSDAPLDEVRAVLP